MSVTFFRLRHYAAFQSSELGMSDTGDDWMRPCCGDAQSVLACVGSSPALDGALQRMRRTGQSNADHTC